jgi:cyclophilin family peptidyl-prolyl cis-trans isomerase
MPSEKRQRQDAGRMQRQAAQREMTKKQQRNRSIRGFAVVLALVAVAAAGIAIFSGGGDDDDVATGASTTTAVPGAPVELTYPGSGASNTGDTPCPAADGSAERTTAFEKAPSTCIDAAKTYTALVETSEGDITIQLDPAKAPVAVNNFVVLARYHYYDGVPFHRIVADFVDQAGMPVGPTDPAAADSPGYTIPDELPDTSSLASPADAYPDGSLATANRGPDTASAQWFIVVKGGGQQFAANPNYSVFGQVTEGLDVAETINTFGDGTSTGTPLKQITIEKVTITES